MNILDKIFKPFCKNDCKAESKKTWDAFYSAFEKRYRGSFDLIFERLKARYTEPLKFVLEMHGPMPEAIDLGCGHGEMLSLLKSMNFSALGIDTSGAACAEVASLGLQAHQGDALEFLRSKQSESVSFLSMLHVVEHVRTEYALEIIREGFRVLKKNGTFLIETPSLFSIWASSRQFYLDPTHIKPVHPDLLQFMGEYVGFASKQLFFDPVEHPLQARICEASSGEMKKEMQKLEEWLYGPMDFALWMAK